MTVANPLADVVKRDRYGRYLVNVDGKQVPHTRVTTIAKAIDDLHNLTQWRSRMVAFGLAKRDDLVLAASLCDPNDKREADRIAEDAVNAAGANVKRELGTKLHAATEALDRGQSVPELPGQFARDLPAYSAALEAAGITVDATYVERLCVLKHHSLAGTFDRLVTLRDGRRVVADLKTGGVDYAWPSIAIQLACYAHATSLYDYRTGLHSSMPDVDREMAIVMHLPAGEGRCTIYEVDLVQGLYGLDLALAVRKYRKSKPGRVFVVPNGADAAPAARVAHVVDRIRAIEAHGSMPYLLGIWPQDVPGFRDGHVHTLQQIERAEVALMQTERETGVPF